MISCFCWSQHKYKLTKILFQQIYCLSCLPPNHYVAKLIPFCILHFLLSIKKENLYRAPTWERVKTHIQMESILCLPFPLFYIHQDSKESGLDNFVKLAEYPLLIQNVCWLNKPRHRSHQPALRLTPTAPFPRQNHEPQSVTVFAIGVSTFKCMFVCFFF